MKEQKIEVQSEEVKITENENQKQENSENKNKEESENQSKKSKSSEHNKNNNNQNKSDNSEEAKKFHLMPLISLGIIYFFTKDLLNIWKENKYLKYNVKKFYFHLYLLIYFLKGISQRIFGEG